MTWRTSSGERVLRPIEGELFFALFDLWWDMNEDCEYIVAVEPFDSLTALQKQSVVEEVLVHLLSETLECPKLSAANESCIWSIFLYLKEQDLETKGDNFGSLILGALEERGEVIRKNGEADEDLSEEDAFWPFVGCQDSEKWDFAIECLADSILWDRDWEMPEVQYNSGLMQMMRIDADYFDPPAARRGAAARVEKFRFQRMAKHNSVCERMDKEWGSALSTSSQMPLSLSVASSSPANGVAFPLQAPVHVTLVTKAGPQPSEEPRFAVLPSHNSARVVAACHTVTGQHWDSASNEWSFPLSSLSELLQRLSTIIEHGLFVTAEPPLKLPQNLPHNAALTPVAPIGAAGSRT